MAIQQSSAYVTKRELTSTLSNYVEKSYVLEYVAQEIEDSLEKVNVYTKSEVDKLLEKYITSIEVNNLLGDNDAYFSKTETRSLINASINAFKNVELSNRLNEYVAKNDLISTISDLYYQKEEIDEKLKGFVTVSNTGNTSIEYYIGTALSSYVKKEELDDKIYSIINPNLKRLEYNVNSKLSTFALKETLNEEIKKLSESVSILDNKVDQYYSKEEVDKKIQMYIRNWCYTREDTRSLIQISIDFFKNNYLESRLDDFVTKEAYYDHIENYYNKEEVDEKLADDGFCNIMHLTEASYNLLKRRNQIKENCIYILYKFDRPVSIYIGTLHLAKRSTTGSIGFPYTFPMSF